MIVHKGSTFAEVYSESLKAAYQNPQFITNPRGMKIHENTDVALVIENPLSCLYENEARSSQFKYIAAELLWYFMGRNDVAFIEQYAKFWASIQNEDGTVNSSYGNLLFSKQNRYGLSQYQWAHDSLVKDKDSRQAVMHFNLPEHQYFGNKDFVCTMYGIFQIRDNRLNLTVSMRSNDAIWGTPTDVAFFSVLLSQMHFHLLRTYPTLELGTYTHVANSYHIYERHFKLVEEMLSFDFKPVLIPKVDANLISKNGESSSWLKILFDHYREGISPINSDLYKWITNHLQK